MNRTEEIWSEVTKSKSLAFIAGPGNKIELHNKIDEKGALHLLDLDFLITIKFFEE